VQDLATGQTADARLPAAAARVRAQERSCEISVQERDTGADFPMQFPFNLALYNITFCHRGLAQ
jgi:hypothetical protein